MKIKVRTENKKIKVIRRKKNKEGKQKKKMK